MIIVRFKMWIILCRKNDNYKNDAGSQYTAASDEDDASNSVEESMSIRCFFSAYIIWNVFHNAIVEAE